MKYSGINFIASPWSIFTVRISSDATGSGNGYRMTFIPFPVKRLGSRSITVGGTVRAAADFRTFLNHMNTPGITGCSPPCKFNSFKIIIAADIGNFDDRGKAPGFFNNYIYTILLFNNKNPVSQINI